MNEIEKGCEREHWEACRPWLEGHHASGSPGALSDSDIYPQCLTLDSSVPYLSVTDPAAPPHWTPPSYLVPLPRVFSHCSLITLPVAGASDSMPPASLGAVKHSPCALCVYVRYKFPVVSYCRGGGMDAIGRGRYGRRAPYVAMFSDRQLLVLVVRCGLGRWNTGFSGAQGCTTDIANGHGKGFWSASPLGEATTYRRFSRIPQEFR